MQENIVSIPKNVLTPIDMVESLFKNTDLSVFNTN